MAEELLTGAEMTDRQLHHKDHIYTCDSPQNWDLKHIVQPAGCSAGWRVSLPGDSFGQNLFHVVGLTSDFSRQLLGLRVIFAAFLLWRSLKFGFNYSERNSNFCLCCHGGLSDYGEFQELPETFWVVYLSAWGVSLQSGMFQSCSKLLYIIVSHSTWHLWTVWNCSLGIIREHFLWEGIEGYRRKCLGLSPLRSTELSEI